MTSDPKELLTHSRMDAFKTCRRKHQFAYELGLRPVEDARALRMGSAFHAGIEALSPAWVDDSDPHAAMAEVVSDPLADACAAVRKTYAGCPEQFDPYWWEIECETILRLVCAYHWRWADSLTMVAPEKSFRISLLNPATGHESKLFDLAGKIDGIVRLEDGRLAVKETKTASDDLGPDSPLWRRLRIDHQISLYIHAARQIGYAVDTVLYDVVRKPSIQPTPVPLNDEDGKKIVLDRDGNRVRTKDGKKFRETGSTEEGYVLQTRPMTPAEWGEKLTADIAERPDFYFARVEIPRLDQDVDEYRSELWDIQQTIRDAQRTGKHYRTVGRNTCPYCPYFNICSEGQDVTYVAPPGFQFVTNPHPELGDDIHERTTCTAEAAPAVAAESPAASGATVG